MAPRTGWQSVIVLCRVTRRACNRFNVPGPHAHAHSYSRQSERHSQIGPKQEMFRCTWPLYRVRCEAKNGLIRFWCVSQTAICYSFIVFSGSTMFSCWKWMGCSLFFISSLRLLWFHVKHLMHSSCLAAFVKLFRIAFLYSTFSLLHWFWLATNCIEASVAADFAQSRSDCICKNVPLQIVRFSVWSVAFELVAFTCLFVYENPTEF